MEKLIFEKSVLGKKAYSLPRVEIPKAKLTDLVPGDYLRTEPAPLPEVSELEIVRHFTRLSRLNYSVDSQMYPLGSCTMKYNPKVNEHLAQQPEWTALHPYQPEELSQGILKMLYETQNYLAEISGMDSVSLAPAAGAHGELLGLLLIRAYHLDKGNTKTKIIVPDSSHGTNPSSAHIAGYKVTTIPSGANGEVDIKVLQETIDSETAAVMLTNPNTLGLFETNIKKIAEIVHSYDALLYCDGANLNAVLGRYRPGDMGFDVLHINLHKTFATPHGGGGPGSGPVAVKKILEPYLPVPRIENKKYKYIFSYDNKKTIGKIRTFYGNVGVIAKAYFYIRSLGKQGLKKVSGYSVLNANYLKEKLKETYQLPYDTDCMHEFVLSANKQLKEHNIRAMDIAKRLLDYGYYAPTVYFPLIVPEALMIEPTETESKSTLDQFVTALLQIDKEVQENPDLLKNAPQHLPVSRLDEVTAARKPNLRWHSEKIAR